MRKLLTITFATWIALSPAWAQSTNPLTNFQTYVNQVILPNSAQGVGPLQLNTTFNLLVPIFSAICQGFSASGQCNLPTNITAGGNVVGAITFMPSNGATSTANLQALLGERFDVTQGFGGSATIDNCSAFQALTAAVQAAGGGTIHIYGNLVSSCAIGINNVPVAIEGDGEGQSSITFVTNNNAGIVISENDGHKRVSVRKLQLYSNIPQVNSYVPALKITFPQVNAPDASATVDHFQVNTNGTGYFNAGIECSNCTHHVFSNINIQGVGLAAGQGTMSNTLQNGIQLTGYSSNGKITDTEITNTITGIEISGDTEGTKITGLNTVSVNYGIIMDDTTSGDPVSGPFFPAPHVTAWHCDAYITCYWSKGWGQAFVTSFNFFKRPQSTAFWTGIKLDNGLYGSLTAASIFNKFTFGRCSIPQGTAGGSDCVTLTSTSNGNTVSNVEPDGVNYFIDEASASTNNTITNNIGFPVYNGFFPNQTSIYNAWRNNPSPYNYTRGNIPAILGSGDASYQNLTPNSATPNVGSFNLLTFHTANTQATTITNFLNGAQGDTIVVVAADANTTIQTNSNIVTTSGQNITLTNGAAYRFVLDGTIWRQV